MAKQQALHARRSTPASQLPRRILRVDGTAVGGAALTEVVYAQVLTKAQRAKLTPDAVIAPIKRGNKRFTSSSTSFEF